MPNGVDFTLGKKVTNYESLYNPSLLARHPRSINREKYEIDNNSLPFVGFDIWHAYEETFLLENGLPVNFILKIKVPCTSKYIVESKSLKLYLFSFAMQRFSGTREEAISVYKNTVESDLSTLLEVPVQVSIFQESSYEPILLTTREFSLLEEVVDLSQTRFTATGEDPSLLKKSISSNFICIKSDMLRSKCLITGQPDTGTIFIYMKGDVPTYESLAQYIFSLREEHHFHEEIVECFYKRLYTIFEPRELVVTALYNRRGGIDICPTRASREDLLPSNLINLSCITEKEYRQ